MLQTYKAHLSKKLQLTSDVWLYTFILLDPSTISFIPGQYLILFVPQHTSSVIPAEATSDVAKAGIQTSGSQIESGMTYARRLYSIASSNSVTNEFELLVKLVTNGCASRYFEKLEIGSEAIFQGPAGMFTLKESPRDKIFMVTGTGYAPVRSMLKSLMIDDRSLKIDFEAGKSKLEKNQTSILQPQDPSSSIQSPSSNSFYLFIGFPYYKDVFFFNELKNYKLQVTSFDFKVCLSREQNLDIIPEPDKQHFLLGRVTNGFEQLILTNFNTSTSLSVNQFQPISNYDFYLCGGREVVESLREYVYQKGAPKEQVFFEKF